MRGALLRLSLLATATAAVAGCGAGAGEGAADTALLVTQDFGRATLAQRQPPETSGQDTVMRLLQRNAEQVETKYGGGFVQSVAGQAGGRRDGRQVDWFFYVNGRHSDEGAASVVVEEGDRIWWDLHDWDTAIEVPAVVGSFPAPFTTGFEGKRLPTRVECVRQEDDACTTVRDALVEEGVPASRGGLATSLAQQTLRVLVGPWERLRGDAALDEVEDGPAASGIFARPAADGRSIALLDDRGRTTRTLRAGAGLVAATAIDDAVPVWVVTGTDEAGVRAAAQAFEEGTLAGRFAVALDGGSPVPVPEHPR